MRAAAKLSELPLLWMARGGEGDEHPKETIDSSKKAHDV